MEDIIIRNGLIVDVENEKIAKGDISVKDGKIVSDEAGEALSFDR